MRQLFVNNKKLKNLPGIRIFIYQQKVSHVRRLLVRNSVYINFFNQKYNRHSVFGNVYKSADVYRKLADCL